MNQITTKSQPSIKFSSSKSRLLRNLNVIGLPFNPSSTSRCYNRARISLWRPLQRKEGRNQSGSWPCHIARKISLWRK